MKTDVQAQTRLSGAHGNDSNPTNPGPNHRDGLTELNMSENNMALELERRGKLLIRGHKPKIVGALTVGMIHELSNPITNILLTAGILQEDYENLPEEERLDMIDSLVKESERAQEIARKFSNFAGEGEIRSETLEVQNIIKGALQLARNKVKRAKVKVKGELAPELPAIYGDQRQLEQVFLNIVLNALDAMPGGGTLTISCESNTDEDSILVEFSDTGLGIPEESIQNIFEPFFTTKPDHESDGLGLSISLEIIKRHGGDIHVKSQPGKGSVFTIQLPTTKHPSDISNGQ